MFFSILDILLIQFVLFTMELNIKIHQYFD